MAKRKFDYFNYFKEIADIICEAADKLNETLNNFSIDSIAQELETLHEIEHKADTARHEMIALLAHEFITPIEREDIVSLAQELDSVVDYIEDVLLRIYMFNITELDNFALEFSSVLVKCTKELNIVVSKFKNFKSSQTIKDCIVHVNNFESEGDKLLTKAIHSLSCSDASDRKFFVWADIYEHFELCIDACEDVCEIIQGVIMKNT